MSTQVAQYEMNPAEDAVLFGDEIADGMWVLPEFAPIRQRGTGEDAAIRAQRFRRVTRLRREEHSGYGGGACLIFVAEWIDGYQEIHSFAVTHGWIVKRESVPGGETA